MSMGDYRVADISLADFGRKEIQLAEVEVSRSLLVSCLTFLELSSFLCGSGDAMLATTDAWPHGCAEGVRP
jgi:hypothetical protein